MASSKNSTSPIALGIVPCVSIATCMSHLRSVHLTPRPPSPIPISTHYSLFVQEQCPRPSARSGETNHALSFAFATNKHCSMKLGWISSDRMFRSQVLFQSLRRWPFCREGWTRVYGFRITARSGLSRKERRPPTMCSVWVARTICRLY